MRIESRPPELRLPPARFAPGSHDNADMREPAQYEQTPARLNDSEREALLLNIDVSLRVHTRPQLFSWVQGTLQSMIPHEVLVCGLQESRQSSWPLGRAGAPRPAKGGLLTPRETQILQWIYHGKSNIEIGMILDISPLTVKNPVQKTLRKLNVLNRTQAVGKALALRLVNP